MNLKNIAIIAHVDHGKTTLVDGLLKQSNTFRSNELLMTQDLIMDSNEQERERGITILAKNTAVTYKDTKINIIDTPGHSDFGGEVERTLNMADGALLLVDAQEGPMPQTKFVLKKALDLGLKIIVVINKIDKKDANLKNTINKLHDLFLELATHEDQLDFPVLYAIGRDGRAWNELPEDFSIAGSLEPVFEAILKHVPSPDERSDAQDANGAFQMLITTLDWDNYKGKYLIGRVKRGSIKPGTKIVLLTDDDEANIKKEEVTVEKVYVNAGLKRVETEEGTFGDIIALTGIKTGSIGDTLADTSNPEKLPSTKIEEPTLSISLGPNTSPFMGKEGKFLTSRQILERIEREMQTNVAMRFKIDEQGNYIISGRGELHLSVFLETLRREGFEIEVGKPTVIIKKIEGVEMEPVEELTIDVNNEYVGAVKSEMGKRRAILILQEENSDASTRLVFEVSTKNLIGVRGLLLTLSKGTAVASSFFLRYEKTVADLQKLRKGVLIASETGKTASYGLNTAQDKGPLFVGPQVPVYQGMIIGINGRDEDLEINVCREKQLTNNRSVGEDGIILTPAIKMSLEQMLGFLEKDELLEITPENLRLRKKILDGTQRQRANRNSK